MAGHAAAILLFLVVLPAWMGSGLADYLCHRATRIEHTSGVPESLLHLLQFSLVGLPVTAALFFYPNAGFFLFAGICILLHHGVAAADLVYANPIRRIAPREQMVHSVLEIAPITAFLLLAAIHWAQFMSLFGLGLEPARFSPEVRLLPTGYIAATLGAAFLVNVLPYAEEFVRCMHARRLPSADRHSRD
jgi:hypothetical protein